jgi:hypothetical protein
MRSGRLSPRPDRYCRRAPGNKPGAFITDYDNPHPPGEFLFYAAFRRHG